MLDEVRLENIRKSYSEKVVVDGLSCSFKKNDVNVLIGESGCGKTTLLRILAGLETADSGSVCVPPRVSMAFQEARLLPWMSVQENVELAVYSLPAAERREKAQEMLQIVGMFSCRKLHPGELSGGMAQRVAIARALASDPQLLLMDEPFGALDALTRSKVRDQFSALHAQRPFTVVLVTHDVWEAALLGSRIFKLAAGRVDGMWELAASRPRSMKDDEVLSAGSQMLDSFMRRA